MKKMKTLFEREFLNGKLVGISDIVTKGCEWVFDEPIHATEKMDGTCAAIIKGKLYARYDYKKGRKLPENNIPCQDKPNEITGHWPHWVLVEDQSHYKHYKNAKYSFPYYYNYQTFEIIGKHFNGNPYRLENDLFTKHGEIIIIKETQLGFEKSNIFNDVDLLVNLSYLNIKEFLEKNYIEGIVFYGKNNKMCKIKRSDFGLDWNVKNSEYVYINNEKIILR